MSACPRCGGYINDSGGASSYAGRHCVCPLTPAVTPPWSFYTTTLGGHPVGCICPAGANLECQRLDCPRKPPRQPIST